MTRAVPERVADTGALQVDELTLILAEGTVHSVFQPIVDLESRSVVAFEALARGPQGPLATPDALFATARLAGRLRELDELCRAAAFLGASENGLVAPLTLFVNVEPEVLDSAPVEELVALADHVPGELRVVIEFTERALTSRPAALLRTASRVRELGWGVALDDVGADPASLAFMALLRPDVIKLDLSLVQKRASPAIAEIMSAVNAHAERTGALILAEGIETERHVMLARALGAGLGQGWLFGRPTPEPAVQPPARPLPLLRSEATGRPDPLASPFACLPSGTSLRHSDKRLLVEVSKQLEREASRLGGACVVASSFQYAWHFTADTRVRYERLARTAGFVCVLGEGLDPEPSPGVRGASLGWTDPMLDEWDVVVLSPHFSAALLARELGRGRGLRDEDRTFEYALTYERGTVVAAAQRMLARVGGSSPG